MPVDVAETDDSFPRFLVYLHSICPPEIRDRGTAYCREGRVVEIRSRSRIHQARVKGRYDEYQVQVDLRSPEHPRCQCSCADFAKHSRCKHLYAFGLELQKREGCCEEALSWRHVLTRVTRSSFRPPAAPPGPEALPVLHYLLDLPRLLLDEGRMLHLYQEYELKSGETRLKPMRISRAMELPFAEEDVRILLRLQLLLQKESYRYDAPTKLAAVFLPPEEAESILALTAASGRLHLVDLQEPPSPEDLMAVCDDRAHPWELILHASTSPDSLRLEPMLRQENDVRSLSDPVQLGQDGLIFWMNRFSVISNPRALPWVWNAAEGARIPQAEINDFLEQFYAIPGAPSLILPPEFAFAEERVAPRPVLRIQELDLQGESVFLPAFRYGKEEVDWIDSRSQFMDAARRTRVPRDREAETISLHRLDELGGALRQGDANGYWTSDVKTFANLLETLDAEGWDLRVRDQRLRTRGQGKLTVQTSGIDWFELDGGLRFDGEEIPLPEILEAIRRKERYVVLKRGGVGLIPEAWQQRLGLLDRLTERDVDGEVALRVQGAAALWLDLLLAELPGIDWNDEFVRLRGNLRQLAAPVAVDPPAGFRGTLREYQREGLGWLRYLQDTGMNGCLADDMGLGKTVQVLALLEERRPQVKGPSLAVLPRSLTFNWIQEAARFTPALRVVDLSGPSRPKAVTALPQADLYLISYQTLLRDITWLKSHRWDYVILDESQAIKNGASKTSKAVRLLQSAHRLTLTGTPVENRLEDLWSQFNFLNPGLLGPKLQEAKDLSPQSLELIARGLRPFLLRRTKEQVARDLPEKVEETLYCELGTSQRKLYEQMREYYQKSLAAGMSEKGIQKTKFLVLEALLRLRQAACHPGLLSEEHSKMDSAKLTALETLLEDILSSGHKALVFSQFTRFLDLLRTRLDREGVPYAYLDGQTRDRPAQVQRFQEDPDCPLFLISLKAGGVGLNLTAADYVILLDPWWNPAIEAQAIDRAHRIGQTKNVFAYRIVARDTIEEKILLLQAEKRQLADAILTEENRVLSQLTSDELQFLLS